MKTKHSFMNVFDGSNKIKYLNEKKEAECKNTCVEQCFIMQA